VKSHTSSKILLKSTVCQY